MLHHPRGQRLDDLQLNFGVIARESMGDTVKVTVIATGFGKEKEEDRREPAIEVRPPADFFTDRGGAVPVRVIPEPVLEPPPVAASAAIFEDELDVPAYVRQGKLLN